MEEVLWLSPAGRLRRSWRQRERGAPRDRAAGRERRVEHGGRPYRGFSSRAGPAAAPPAPQGPGPHRLRRRHARVPGVADRAVAAPALLGRHDGHRGHAERGPQGPRRLLDAGVRRGRAGQGRSLGRGHHRDAGPVVLAGRDAGHRPQGAAAPRGAAAVHRRRRAPVHLATNARKGQLADLELRHHRRAAARTGSAMRRTPGCATSRSKASPRTRSGARSSPWPANCWPGPRCSP